MRNVRAPLQAKLDSGTASLVDCAKITLRNGTIIYMVDYPVDMLIGANLYKSTYGYRGSASNSNAGISPDSIDIQFVLGAGITKEDIISGSFDGAEIRTFMTDADDPLEDDVKLTRGFFGKAEMYDNRIRTEYTSLISKLDQQVGEQTSTKCRAELGDSACKVPIDPPVWEAETAVSEGFEYDAGIGTTVKPSTQTGYYYVVDSGVAPGLTGVTEPSWPVTTGVLIGDGDVVWRTITAKILNYFITSVTDVRHFEVGLAEASGTWDYGSAEFITGNNAGYSKEIKTQTGFDVELFDALPFLPEIGDEIKLTVGCKKRVTDCSDIFDNIFNYRGEPYIPTKAEIFRFGGQ